MKLRLRFRRLSISGTCISMVLGGAFTMQGAAAQARSPKAVVEMDRATLNEHLRTLGYRTRGGIATEKAASSDPLYRALPHFSSSFTVAGTTYPYTMLGYAPQSGRTSNLHSVIVPLRMNFSGFGKNQDVSVSFDPKDAVSNIVNSPMYEDAQFANGKGQFGDMMQRATFWNKMDEQKKWHVKMAGPRVLEPIDIEVTPETGTLSRSGSNYFGDVLIDFLDAQMRTIVQLAKIEPEETPIFVTQDVTAEALGYHSAYATLNRDGTETLQTMIYTSWLDPRFVDPLVADVSTFNHEEAEWLNDPFINNAAPDWRYPPESDSRAVCSFNPSVEVGDPQGNGPTYDDFPTIVIPVDGFPYHLQDLVMLPWFAGETPSSAENGWYDFPATNLITAPAVYCK